MLTTKTKLLALLSLLLLFGLLLSACGSEQIETNDLLVTPQPTLVAFTNQPEITPELTAAIREYLDGSLEFDPYTETELDDGSVHKSIILKLVSSGILDRASYTLDSGETVQFDILYAYQLTQARTVIVVPLVIGMETEDGQYAYFSSSYIYRLTHPQSDSPTFLERHAVLQDVLATLPQGKVFVTSISNLADRTSADWNSCPTKGSLDAGYSPVFCQAAAQIDQGYGSLVIQRAATRLPEGWMLIGWFFYAAPEAPVLDF